MPLMIFDGITRRILILWLLKESSRLNCLNAAEGRLKKMGEKQKILIADSQFLTTDTLLRILEVEQNYSLCGVAGNRSVLTGMLKTHRPDLLITDINLLDYEGTDDLITVIKEYQDMSFLVLTNQITNAEVHELLVAGINNIALKTDSREEILYSIEMALKHRKHFSDNILDLILEMNSGRNTGTEPHDINQEAVRLTTSEQDIVKLIAEGFTTKQIASRKNISFHTVMTHRKNIFRKLSINNVSDLTRYAIRKGYIDNIEYNI